MSTSFLTIAQANAKLGSSISGTSTSFVTKAQLVASGKADVSKLTSYSDNQYPIDNDIVAGITFSDVNVDVFNSSFTNIQLHIHRSTAPSNSILLESGFHTISIPSDIVGITMETKITAYSSYMLIQFPDSTGLSMSNLRQAYCNTGISNKTILKTTLTRTDNIDGWWFACDIAFTNAGKSYNILIDGGYADI